MTILDTIAAYAAQRVEEDQKIIPLAMMADKARSLGKGRGEDFVKALKKPGMSAICEVKKASPSKGVIDPVFDYTGIAKAYEEAGAEAVSCLTEPKWFLGSDEIFLQVRKAISLPMLRKDFTVSDYQIYQARVMEANAVLLIVALMDEETLTNRLALCHDLGLAALVETHNEEEIQTALSAGAEILGVNNRNLKDFSVDVGLAARLRDSIPSDCIFVAESGIRNRSDVETVSQAGADAILVGETLMRAADKTAMLQELKGMI